MYATMYRSRIFTRGFTARQRGHGFGLRDSYLVAEGMSGEATHG